MARFAPAALLAALLTAAAAPAADQKAIDAAVERGKGFLKSRFKTGVPPAAYAVGMGSPALAGIALIEAKVPANDPTLKALAESIRAAAYTQTQTYQLALCLIFLDRLEDPADVPLIQILAARLISGQNNQGGWTYASVDPVADETAQWLRGVVKNSQLVAGPGRPPAGAPDKPAPPAPARTGKLDPEVAKYAAALWAARKANPTDDNSNTQFAVLAVWAARKHGVPVEQALDLVEKRFLATQDPRTGTWPYSGNDMPGDSTPSMTCSGLLGLATGVARREERLRGERDRPKEPAPKTTKAADPFFNPPAGPAKKPAEGKRPTDARDRAVAAGFAHLGAVLRNPRQMGQRQGDGDLYFLWSLERVGVIFGVDKIGGVDWYAAGADAILRAQQADGSWGGNYGEDVSTSFALLFLTKANVARDLSSKLGKGSTELRSGPAGPAGASDPAPVPKSPGTGRTAPATPRLPTPAEAEADRVAGQLVRAGDADWAKALERVRDAKGGENTKALLTAIRALDGGRKKEAREALAERLTRMSADTLRAMAKDADAELRRGAVLACAMRDDKAHVPDLIDRLTDEEELVVRAAVAGLKSLTGQDFGPTAGATAAQRKAAADAWRAWWAKQKK